jgi:hypothetical protein
VHQLCGVGVWFQSCASCLRVFRHTSEGPVSTRHINLLYLHRPGFVFNAQALCLLKELCDYPGAHESSCNIGNLAQSTPREGAPSGSSRHGLAV